MRPELILAAAAALASAGAAAAQLLPSVPVGPVVGQVGRIGGEVLDTGSETVRRTTGSVRALARERLDRLRGLVRANADVLEMTDEGPAVRGEILAVDPEPAVLDAAVAGGFRILADETIEGIALRSVTLEVPAGLSVEKAMRRLREIAPAGEFAPNHIHVQSGARAVPVLAAAALAQGGGARAEIGIIDGGVAAHRTIGPVEQRGFAAGAPAPSPHGTAVASLAAGAAPMRSAAPGAPLLVADIYGKDPKGGNAVAVARALGWMAQRHVKAVAMSLVGPPNPLVGKAIDRAMARGVRVVAPVGNDGPAAPPAYPASYTGVIAVTAVDRRNRALPEAGRALHLDFAAPGADMAAAAPGGGFRAVRGTSFAVPLVAGRLAGGSLAGLRKEAQDLGPRGADKSFGHGLVCGRCRTALPRK